MPYDTTDHEQHLRLLSIFHYVVGGLMGLFACIPLIHVTIGIMVILSPETVNGDGQRLSELMGWLFIVMGGLFVVMGWVMAACVLMAGRFLARRVRYTYCLVIAAIECIFMPFGTVLGVFTIIVLTRSHVKAMFQRTSYAH